MGRSITWWGEAFKHVTFHADDHIGKGTDTHVVEVVADAVGAPSKDTSDPSMNILINVMAIVSLVMAPLL